MPTIALTLSLFFSAFLIVRDCRRRRDVSWAVWIPTIFLMVLASRPVSRWFTYSALAGIENANELPNSPIDQLFFLVTLTASLLVATARGVNWRRVLANNPALVLFYVYFAVSICWSADPGGSTKRIIKDFGMLFVAGVIFSEKNPLRALRATFVRSAFLLFPLSIVFINYYPSIGRAYGGRGDMMFTGVTTQKNSLGEMVLLFSLFLVWDYLETVPSTKFRIKNVPLEIPLLLLLGFQLLRLSQSKSSLTCLTVSMFLLLRGRKLMSKSISRFVLAGAMALPCLVLFSAKFSDVIAPVLHALGRDTTFTGRTEIWTHITLDTVNPLIGAGYWNFWGGPGGLAFNESLHEVIPNAHNGYVDIYLDGGVIGLTVLLILLVVEGGKLSKRVATTDDSNRLQRMRFAILIAAIIFNLSESTFARIDPIWFTTLLMIWEFPSKLPVKKTVKSLNWLEKEDVPEVAGVHSRSEVANP